MLVVVAGMVVSFVTAVAADSGRSGSLTGVPANAKALGFAPASATFTRVAPGRIGPRVYGVGEPRGNHRSAAASTPTGSPSTTRPSTALWGGRLVLDRRHPWSKAAELRPRWVEAVLDAAARRQSHLGGRPRVGERRRSRSQLAL